MVFECVDGFPPASIEASTSHGFECEHAGSISAGFLKETPLEILARSGDFAKHTKT